MRAALLWLERRRMEDPRTPSISLPCSENEARKRTQTDLFSRLQNRANTADTETTSLSAGIMRGIPAPVVDEAIREANEMLYEEGEEQMEGEEKEGMDDDSDLESVATDAGEEGEEYLFTALDHTGGARRAIEEQTFARVLFDLACVAPKLGQLGRYLRDTQGASERA